MEAVTVIQVRKEINLDQGMMKWSGLEIELTRFADKWYERIRKKE